ncbi:MAG: NADH-quinone oxidoreductase subunit C [candidate division WOR-3 bacterium]
MKSLINLIEHKLSKEKILFSLEIKDILTLKINKENLLKVFKILRYSEELLFDYLIDITACDYKEKNIFEVIYHLLSFIRNERIRIKVELEREKPEIESVCSIYPGANWFEREVYDLFGIRFLNHPNLKRILLWESFPGYPLRKDYKLEEEGPIPTLEDIY